MKREEIWVRSSLDGTMQPSLFFEAEGENRPCIVGLHTWSFGRENQIQYLLPMAEELNFHLLLPEFRGPNFKTNPEPMKACGSLYAKTDIQEAIDAVIRDRKIDRDNIFLVGLSGGGHMALLMAGFIPEYFRAVAPFVPISDLGLWLQQSPEHYHEHILACTGGDPEEMDNRSPLKYLDDIARANIKIFHGKRDPVVPVTQSITFYNRMLREHPEARVYLDIFDGGHQFEEDLCKKWILSQYQPKTLSAVTG